MNSTVGLGMVESAFLAYIKPRIWSLALHKLM